MHVLPCYFENLLLINDFYKMFKRKNNYARMSEESMYDCDEDGDSDLYPPNEKVTKFEKNEIIKKQKQKSFLKSLKSIILLKKFRSSKGLTKITKSEKYDELQEEFDDSKFEIVLKEGERGLEDETLENIMFNRKQKLDKSTKRRMKEEKTKRDRKKNEKTVKIDPKATQFKKKKSAKKKALKATKRTGKFIGRGMLYTGSAFQYIAPVTSLPPERNWTKWKERPSPATYRQSEYMFL